MAQQRAARFFGRFLEKRARDAQLSVRGGRFATKRTRASRARISHSNSLHCAQPPVAPPSPAPRSLSAAAQHRARCEPTCPRPPQPAPAPPRLAAGLVLQAPWPPRTQQRTRLRRSSGAPRTPPSRALSHVLPVRAPRGGRFSEKIDPLMEKFNESLSFDKRMWAEVRVRRAARPLLPRSQQRLRSRIFAAARRTRARCAWPAC